MSLRPALVQLFLKDAYLCVEKSCETISNDSSECPRCHSAVMLLATPVNREPQTREGASVSRPEARPLHHGPLEVCGLRQACLLG